MRFDSGVDSVQKHNKHNKFSLISFWGRIFCWSFQQVTVISHLDLPDVFMDVLIVPLEKELVGDRLQEVSSEVWVYKQPTNIKVCGRPQHVPPTSSSSSCLRGTWEPFLHLFKEDLGKGLSPFVFRVQLELGQVDVHVVEVGDDLKFEIIRNF